MKFSLAIAALAALTAKASAAAADCYGYPCCSNPNAIAVTTDEKGEWSIEKGEWCYIGVPKEPKQKRQWPPWGGDQGGNPWGGNPGGGQPWGQGPPQGAPGGQPQGPPQDQNNNNQPPQGAPAQGGGNGGSFCSSASHSGQSIEVNSNKVGDIGGVGYELWADSGNNSATFYSDGSFSCKFQGAGDYLCRSGLSFDSTKTPAEIGRMKADFKLVKGNVSNAQYSYVGIYGWTRNPLVEYYIVDNWLSPNRPGDWVGNRKLGSFTIDGAQYTVYENTRNNAPSIDGNTTFKQYFSIREQARDCGTIDISAHFDQWEKLGLKMGKLHEAKILGEAGGGVSGSIDFPYAKVYIGDNNSAPAPGQDQNQGQQPPQGPPQDQNQGQQPPQGPPQDQNQGQQPPQGPPQDQNQGQQPPQGPPQNQNQGQQPPQGPPQNQNQGQQPPQGPPQDQNQGQQPPQGQEQNQGQQPPQGPPQDQNQGQQPPQGQDQNQGQPNFGAPQGQPPFGQPPFGAPQGQGQGQGQPPFGQPPQGQDQNQGQQPPQGPPQGQDQNQGQQPPQGPPQGQDQNQGQQPSQGQDQNQGQAPAQGGGAPASYPYPLKNAPVPSKGCGKNPSLPKTGQFDFQWSGGKRMVIIDAPENYDSSKPYRLVFGMQCMGGSAQNVKNENYYGLKPLDTGKTTIFVAPQGNGQQLPWGEADYKLFDELLDKLKSEFCIDESRVFSTGFSYGSMFSNGLSWNHQKVLRGVAVYETAERNIYLPQNTGDGIGWMGVLGLDDGLCTPEMGRKARDIILKNNAKGNTSEQAQEAAPNGPHKCYDYTSVDEKFPLRWCTQSGGHIWDHKDPGQGQSWVPQATWEFINKF